MKIGGIKVNRPAIKTIVFAREDEDFVFKARAVLDYDEFEELCQRPTAPEVLRPGGIRESNVNAKSYQEALDKWAGYRTSWMIIKSLDATSDLEWETYSRPARSAQRESPGKAVL